MQAKNPPILQYVCLALLFALASAYQIRSTMYSFPNYFHLQVAGYPFYPSFVNSRPLAQFVGPSAQRAGLKENDILLALNGKPFTGLAVFGEAIRHAKPGDPLTVTVLTPGDTTPRNATLFLGQATSPRVAWATLTLLAIKLVMPTFCILLGFWVPAVRPRDPSAWLLCFIMLFFSVFYSAGVGKLGARRTRRRRRAYRVAIGNSWPIFMLLFGALLPRAVPWQRSCLVEMVQAHRHHRVGRRFAS